MILRREVIDQLTWISTQWMTGEFIDGAIRVIELAAADRKEEMVELGDERLAVRDVVRDWELEDLVNRARNGETVRHGPDLEYVDGSWWHLDELECVDGSWRRRDWGGQAS
jgi:hypothetical protein